jgi:hypothetical protein
MLFDLQPANDQWLYDVEIALDPHTGMPTRVWLGFLHSEKREVLIESLTENRPLDAATFVAWEPKPEDGWTVKRTPIVVPKPEDAEKEKAKDQPADPHQGDQ